MTASYLHTANDVGIFVSHESAVRSYCRHMPNVFTKAKNADVWDEAGVRFIDFFSACGALNYGHNDSSIKQAALDHLQSDSILCGLDLHTSVKRRFIDDFQRIVLAPRALDYRLQFPGPTGTNAVEAALKLARKITGRRHVVAFSRAFHGMTLGALAATASSQAREGAGVPLENVIRLAYDGDTQSGCPTLAQFAADHGSERPAAFIVETVQGEGGLHVASTAWLQAVEDLASRLGSVLIVDDIQAGCGRTGDFFSFERAGIKPDIVCLAKSISGLGLPMALVLIRPDLDVWRPGEHNGTFRGNNLAFATSSASLAFWEDPRFLQHKMQNEDLLKAWLAFTSLKFSSDAITPCGLGMMTGLRFQHPGQAERVARECVQRGILIETAGPDGDVLKMMPPLTIPHERLLDGLDRISTAIDAVMSQENAITREAA